MNERLSVEAENKFVTDTQNWPINPYFVSEDPVTGSEDQTKQVKPETIQPVLPKQDLKIQSIKSFSSWQSLVKETIAWINKNIHPARIVSISVVLHHSTTAGQCTIFYDNSSDDYMRMKIKPVAQCYISGAIVETAKNWEAHHTDVMNTANKLKDNGGILCIS